MSVPKVVIVGRPNVGKSSLLNWLSGKRISIVEPTPGVTRDRVAYLMHVDNRYFELVDTGGIGIVDSDALSEDIERQIQTAIDEATLVLFVVDAMSGPMPLDTVVAQRLRKLNKPVLLVVNKCDTEKLEQEVAEFHRILNTAMVWTSVTQNRHRNKLLDTVLNLLPTADDTEAAVGSELVAEPELKLAIVGRRNVGKSTFINALAQSERMIVSEIPGTTRDSVDVRFELDGKAFIAIDTPGVRKKKSLENDIEYYGLLRAMRSIRRADVVLMFLAANETVSAVDKQLVHDILEEFKPCIFVVNKWDLSADLDMSTESWTDYLLETFPSTRHAPFAFITAKDERNIKKLINLAQTIAKQARLRVSTSRLNKVIRAAVLANRPPMRATKQPKVYYGTQVATSPPTIVLKCNHPKLFDKSWQRYLLGVLQQELPFKEVPIKLYLRPRGSTVVSHLGIEELAETDAILNDENWAEEE
ncbi:MAG: ribosome biogenesis GTPase Der [Planctomycetales bacterium]|nr:ribosome biogenesis GTPase Der [Planctomycetales bacterium]